MAKTIYEDNILKNPRIFIIFFSSFIFLIFSAILTVLAPEEVFAIIILAQISGCIFFPLAVGYFYEQFKKKQEGETIWKVFREFSEGGILRVYKDREESEFKENALNDLREAFEKHSDGEIKLIGVTLRVFFHDLGAFYRCTEKICDRHSKRLNNKIAIRALICDLESPEVLNRARIETPDSVNDPQIKVSIKTTIASIQDLKKKYGKNSIEYKTYLSAPYCTAVIFPGKCYFSPNLLSTKPPVKLPMIVFSKESWGYEKINKYFDYLWNPEPELNDKAK